MQDFRCTPKCFCWRAIGMPSSQFRSNHTVSTVSTASFLWLRLISNHSREFIEMQILTPYHLINLQSIKWMVPRWILQRKLQWWHWWKFQGRFRWGFLGVFKSQADERMQLLAAYFGSNLLCIITHFVVSDCVSDHLSYFDFIKLMQIFCFMTL